MDALYSAIKSRRGGLLNDDEENAHQEPAPQKGGGMDMKSLVSALSDDQKMQLLKMLVSGDGDKEAPSKMTAQSIEKGGMGPGEEEELEEASDLGGEHESEEEIAESLLSSGDKYRADRGDKPRNLGERMKFGLASKLKQKKG